MFYEQNLLGITIENPEDEKENINENVKNNELKNEKSKIKVYKKPIFNKIKENSIEKSISPIIKLENSFIKLNLSSSNSNNSFLLSSIKDNKKNSKENYIKSIKSLNEFYSNLESKKLFCQYAKDIEILMKKIDKTTLKIPSNFLKRHKISKELRMKMINWMIEVLTIYKCSEETFFLSVNILDLYIFKSKTILFNEEIHLIGLISMFIASKFEDIYFIPLYDIEYNIGYNNFTKEQLKNMELKILKVINFENIFNTSVYDFLKIYLFDFFTCNQNKILENEIIFSQIKETSIYLSKVTLFSDYFYCINNSFKALCCIKTSIQMVFYFSKQFFDNLLFHFYCDWVNILIEKNDINEERFNEFCNYLYETYVNFSNIYTKNLEKFYPISYLK